jgi:hypothetical protein
MAEFCALLQLNGIVRTHLNDLPKAKLVKIIEILKGGPAQVYLEGNEMDDAQAAAPEPGMWDSINLSILPYEIVEREIADDADRAALQMRLPDVDDPRALGISGGLFGTWLNNVEMFGDVRLMISRILPEWEERSGVALTDEERRAWTFLLVIVRYPEAVVKDRPDDVSFEGLLLPGPQGSATIREVRRIAGATT